MSYFYRDDPRDRIIEQLENDLGRDMFFEPHHRPLAPEMFNSSPKPFTRMGWPDDGHHRRGRRMRDRHSSGSSGFSEEEDSGRASGECSSQGSGAAENSGVERTIPIQIIREDSATPVNRTKSPVTRTRSHGTTALGRKTSDGPQHSVSSSDVDARLPKTNEDEIRRGRAASAPPDDYTFPKIFNPKVKVGSDNDENVGAHAQPERHQHTGVVRRIPIVIEGKDDTDSTSAKPKSSYAAKSDPSPQYSSSPWSNQATYSPRQSFSSYGSSPRHNQTHFSSSPRQDHQYESVPKQDTHVPFHRPEPSNFSQRKNSPQYTVPPKTDLPQHHFEASPKPPTPEPEKPKELSAMEKLDLIEEEVKQLRKTVEIFSGVRESKDFLYLDEMLTRSLLKLDVIDTGGRDDIRQKRKAIVKLINGGIEELEAKAKTGGGNKTVEETNKPDESQSDLSTSQAQSNPEGTQTENEDNPQVGSGSEAPPLPMPMPSNIEADVTPSETQPTDIEPGRTTTPAEEEMPPSKSKPDESNTPVSSPSEKRMRSEITINLEEPNH